MDRLLTGFDAPTIQMLYVDRELRYQKLLQAFSRTNRTCLGKSKRMIVTFRKPKTMVRNVRDAIKLFSNEERDWENLVPKQYAEVRQELKAAHKKFKAVQKELANDPDNIKKKLQVIKSFQALGKLEEAIKSYEEYEEDFGKLSAITKTIIDEVGNIENLKGEVKVELGSIPGGEIMPELLEIEFSANQKATLEEKIDSYYIAQLLRDIENESSKQKFNETIENKPLVVKAAYETALASLSDELDTIDSIENHFRQAIDGIIADTALLLKLPKEDLQVSFNEYRKDKAEVPYINIMVEKSTITREEFEEIFNKKFRERRRTIEEYWKNVIDEKLLPLREELLSFASEIKK